MTELRDLIEARLREAGLKLTPQRFAVLDYLVRHPTHPTAEQIGAGVNRRFPRVSRATIYNTLHSLCEEGLVHEVYLEDATARYDANVKPTITSSVALAAGWRTSLRRRWARCLAPISKRAIAWRASRW